MERPFCSSELCRQSMCVVPNLTYYQQYRNALSSLFPLYHFQKLFYFDFGLHIGSDLSLFLLIVASGMQSATVFWISSKIISWYLYWCLQLTHPPVAEPRKYYCRHQRELYSPIPELEWGKLVARVRQLKEFLLNLFPILLCWICRAFCEGGKTLMTRLLCFGAVGGCIVLFCKAHVLTHCILAWNVDSDRKSTFMPLHDTFTVSLSCPGMLPRSQLFK